MRSMLLPAVVCVTAFGLALAGPAAARADEAPAVIRVTLPADAKLTIDGDATKATSADRTFVTPPLEKGKDFQYTLKAEFVHDGDQVTVERRITVRAGQQTAADLNLRAAGAFAQTGNAGSPSFYYSPGAPMYTPPVSGYVGRARENWRPRGPGRFRTADDW